MRIVGIDPGLSGAIALVVDGRPDRVEDIPTIADGTGRVASKRRKVAASMLFDLVADMAPEEVVIERVSAMPGQGVTSVFRFGAAYGAIQGVCGAMRLPVAYVTPQAWKKHWGLAGADKDAARSVVIERYPHMREAIARKKDVDRAEAVLIAMYWVLTSSAK